MEIKNSEVVIKRMNKCGILNCDEIWTINNDSPFNGQKMDSLGHVLEKKNGRNLPRISKCFLEAGHREIAEDLLHCSKAELDEYSAVSG